MYTTIDHTEKLLHRGRQILLNLCYRGNSLMKTPKDEHFDYEGSDVATS
jgi:hypothetical protein